MRAWEGGTLNYTVAADQLAALESEAVARQHNANQAYAELLQGVLRAHRASHDQAVRHFRDARELFEQVGNQQNVLLCDLYLGECLRNQGDLDRARGIFRRAYSVARQLGNQRIQLICRAQEGQVLFIMGQLQDALPLLQEAITLSYTPALLRDHVLIDICIAYSNLAEIYLEMGDAKQALENARASLHIADSSKALLCLGLANRTLGIVLTVVKAPATGRLINPDDYFEAALRYYTELKAEADIAMTMLTYGESLRRRRQKMAAGIRFQEAMNAFKRLGMTAEAERANEAYQKIIRDS
ncbi:MAG: tetratricopeptide repeat protein [Anaerolineae bacterium]